MTTLHELTNPTSKHILPCGVEIITHKLLTKDYQSCLTQFGYFLEALAISTETPEPTVEDIRKFLPVILMEVYSSYTGVGETAIDAFFKIFTDSLNSDIIAQFDLSDFEKMWQIIYEGNKIPFEMRLRLLVNGGAIKQAMDRYKEGMAMMKKAQEEAELETQSLSIPSLEPVLIPEMEVLQSNTSSPSQRSKSNTKTK